ncbi:MAG: DegT/DnrJ/EryC1/StrS family aminotransferase [Candidatus Bathyarchaeota archaeon]|nr:DegT/DnrJ/EryC1/StrS family aminotransferase [Candidatus Termiticorpusculum sp.]
MLTNNLLSSQPFFPEDSLQTILREIEDTLRGGMLTGGPHLAKFEQDFAEYNKIKYAVGVNSGTASLEIALRHFDIKDKEVIVPTNTFISTPNAVIFAGGKPVLADIQEDTLCINIEDVKRKLTSKTAGIIIVHVAGLICPQINELKQFCNENNLFLLEDASHAHGAMIDGKMAGTLGDVGCFSLYPTKVITSCEGGMIISNDTELTEDARCMRNCGQTTQKKVVMLGHNWRLSEIAAIVGKNQLPHLERFIAQRNKIATYYNNTLSKINGVTLFRVPPNIRHSYYKYPIKLANEINRDTLALKMKEKGIETGSVYSPPCHLQPYYLKNYPQTDKLSIAETTLQKVLCLPMHVNLTQENLQYITDTFTSSLNEL